MQTSAAGSLLAPSGVRQVALLEAGQLEVGAIVTGVAWQTVRRVVEIEGSGAAAVVTLEKLPPTVVTLPHLHAFTLHSNSQCACGLRREPISGLLPIRGQIARTYILQPIRTAREVDVYSIYSLPGGAVVSPFTNRRWSGTMPVIPVLRTVWRLPDELRRLILPEGDGR